MGRAGDEGGGGSLASVGKVEDGTGNMQSRVKWAGCVYIQTPQNMYTALIHTAMLDDCGFV